MKRNWTWRGLVATLIGIPVTVIVAFTIMASIRPITHCGDSRRVKAAADIFAIVEAVEAFRYDHGRVPTSDEGIAALVTVNPTSPSAYLVYVPSDPWGRGYSYTEDGAHYRVVSFGADGAVGGFDDNADIDSESLKNDSPNNPLQPTRAAQPNGEWESAGSGPRG